MTEETNDKILFRQTRLPVDSSPNLPADLRWAIGEGAEFIEGGFGGGQSTIGSITFAPGGTNWDDDDDYDPNPDAEVKPTVPTPVIRGVAESNVYQTLEGMSKADVWISVDGMDGVEYEVVVSHA